MAQNPFSDQSLEHRIDMQSRSYVSEGRGESATPIKSPVSSYLHRTSDTETTTISGLRSGGGGGSGGGPQLTFGTPGALSNAAQRLGKVAEKFSTFYTDLEHERQSRRQTESSRYGALSESISRLEHNLELEIRRRSEADKTLQAQVNAELKSMYERVSAQTRETQKSLKTSMDALSRSFTELNSGLREEREQRNVQVEQLAQRLMLKIDESKASLEDERVSRLEREAQTLKRVGEDIFRLQERLEKEKANREASMHSLQSEVNEMAGGRNLSDEKFQALVLGELAGLKNKMQLEREERISEDEQIVLAINDYTKALQDGLRIVSAG